jgi:SnoaL-like domain
MSADDALAVVRAYHDAWTNKRFEEAIALLSPSLEVEVPINEYPTRESFAEALAGFGGLVTEVDLLSEMGAGDEVMQLYDIEVQGLGTLRVVEHFTVARGLITRLRQIHDTAAIRAGAA